MDYKLLLESKQDLETYSDKDVQSLQRYYQLNQYTDNLPKNDILWILSIVIYTRSQIAHMDNDNSYSFEASDSDDFEYHDGFETDPDEEQPIQQSQPIDPHAFEESVQRGQADFERMINSTRWTSQLVAHSAAFANRSDIENSDKILLPTMVLEELLRLDVQFPYLFKITNPDTQLSAYCGVLEFTAPVDEMVLPYWMMQSIGQLESTSADISNVILPKGKFVQLKPKNEAFYNINDPKQELEEALRTFSVLWTGMEIELQLANVKVIFDVTQTRSTSRIVDAINILNTDLEVDFAENPDLVVPESKMVVHNSEILHQQLRSQDFSEDSSDESDSSDEDSNFSSNIGVTLGGPSTSTSTSRDTAARLRAARLARYGK